MRFAANRKCIHCGELIGYDRSFWKQPEGVIHFTCQELRMGVDAKSILTR
jgi:hypothetical protein